MNRIRVLIADDHPVVRAGLLGMISAQADLLVVGEAESGAEAVALCATLSPDVVLMDLRMPGTDGVAATAQIRARHPRTHVLVLTTYDSDRDIVRAIEAGATGYLLKDVPREELFRAIRKTAKGQSELSPSAAAVLMRRARGPREEGLSLREAQVLRQVAAGQSNKEIAAHLRISEATVKTHLLNIFGKLAVDDRTAAVTVALRRGLLQLGDPGTGESDP